MKIIHILHYFTQGISGNDAAGTAVAIPKVRMTFLALLERTTKAKVFQIPDGVGHWKTPNTHKIIFNFPSFPASWRCSPEVDSQPLVPGQVGVARVETCGLWKRVILKRDEALKYSQHGFQLSLLLKEFLQLLP